MLTKFEAYVQAGLARHSRVKCCDSEHLLNGIIEYDDIGHIPFYVVEVAGSDDLFVTYTNPSQTLHCFIPCNELFIDSLVVACRYDNRASHVHELSPRWANEKYAETNYGVKFILSPKGQRGIIPHKQHGIMFLAQKIRDSGNLLVAVTIDNTEQCFVVVDTTTYIDELVTKINAYLAEINSPRIGSKEALENNFLVNGESQAVDPFAIYQQYAQEKYDIVVSTTNTPNH